MPARGDLIALLAACLGGGCLPVAPPVRPDPPLRTLQASPGRLDQEALKAAGRPALSGRFEGTCPGAVVMEIRSPGSPDALTTGRFTGGGYLIHLPEGENPYLRYGCDADGDGTVTGADVQTIRLGSQPASVTVHLMLAGTPPGAPVTLVHPSEIAPALLPLTPGAAGPALEAPR